MNNNYYFSPWEDKFLESISYTKNTLMLVAPFIKLTTIKKIISALPKDRKIKLILISRFSKQVFLQKSSDLSLFDYLINHNMKNLKCFCYKLNRLHSKIYIVDNNLMYITSSNLSYSGLIRNHEVAIEINNENEISHIKKEILVLAKDKVRIQNENISQMIEDLKVSNYNLLQKAKEIIPTVEDTIDETLSIKDEIVDIVTNTEEEKSLTTIEQLEYNKLLEEINKYKNQRFTLDLSILNNKLFKTIALGNVELSKELITDAKQDFNQVELHIKDTFSNIFSLENSLLLTDLVNCFIHPTWQNKFQNITSNFSKERKEFFSRIGKSIFNFNIALHISKTRLFKQNSNKLFNDMHKYIRINYPFGEALESTKCNIYLYNGNIKKIYMENIFYELMGIFYWYEGFKKFQSIFYNYFNYIDEYIYDDYKSFEYKSLLQEMTQQKFGLPKYIEKKANGLEHQKIFEFEVYINDRLLGKGLGTSKKYAQEDSAKEAIKNFINKYGYIEKIEKNIRLTKYVLTDSRKKELMKLNDILFFKISNLSLLDISFTHISWIKNHSFSRTNTSLSFLGAILENTCRNVGVIRNFNELNQESLIKYIKFEQSIKVSVILEKYFDENNLENYVNSISNNIPTSIKTDVVQSLIAIYFLENGFENTIKYVRKIWKNFEIQENIQYVNQLQEYLQNESFGLNAKDIQYVVLSETGLSNQKSFKIGCFVKKKLYGVGHGLNKKEAKRISAQKTLEHEEFKVDYHLSVTPKPPH